MAEPEIVVQLLEWEAPSDAPDDPRNPIWLMRRAAEEIRRLRAWLSYMEGGGSGYPRDDVRKALAGLPLPKKVWR